MYTTYNNTVFLGGEDGSIVIWSFSGSGRHISEKFVAKLNGHSKYVTDLLFNPVHDYQLASISQDLTLRLWDVKSK